MADQMIQIERPDPSAIMTEFSPLVTQASLLVVDSQESQSIALNLVKRYRLGQRLLTEHFEPSRKALDIAKKEVLAARDAFIAPLAAAERIVSGKSGAYAEGERVRAEAAAMVAAEEARKREEEAKKRAEEQALQDAIAAEAAGDTEQAADLFAEAQEIESEPVVVPVFTPVMQTATVAGVSERKTWSAELTDIAALVAHVASHPECINYLLPNMPALNALARSQHEAMRIPGVRSVGTVSLSVRS
jgi:hypothetical protein